MTRETRRHPVHDPARPGGRHPSYKEVHDGRALRALTERGTPLGGWRLQGWT